MNARQRTNVALVEAWIEAYNAQDFDRLAREVLAPNVRIYDGSGGHDIHGIDQFTSTARTVARALPDRRYSSVDRILAAGDDAVLMQGEWRGTAAFNLPNGTAAGEQIVLAICSVFDCADGRIAGFRDYH